eukprot:scaffold87031_cov57-Phaeocystis_antarctica.AAC.2
MFSEDEGGGGKCWIKRPVKVLAAQNLRPPPLVRVGLNIFWRLRTFSRPLHVGLNILAAQNLQPPPSCWAQHFGGSEPSAAPQLLGSTFWRLRTFSRPRDR